MKYKEYLYTYRWKHECKNPIRFRFDPVPHTGGFNRPCIRGGIRHMRTTQERRWACAHGDYVRPGRNMINLPNQQDGYWHARREKGWKRTKTKKRQYE